MKSRSQSRSKKKDPTRLRVRSPLGNKFRVLYSEKQIQERVRKLAKEINRDYRDKSLHVVGVVENGFMFMADLLRALEVPITCQLLTPQTHDSIMGTTALREIMYTPRVEAAGKEVLLVDSILQSGVTLDHLYRYVLGQNPRSLRTATLIEKTDERKVDVPTDYVGFKTSGKFLVGYGLGHQGQYRNLPFIARLT